MKPTSPTAVQLIPANAIVVPDNARKASAGLAASVAADGILQPLAVQPDAGGGYRLIFGARRLDAAKKAGLATVPAVVYPADLDPVEDRILALVENIQRETIGPFELGAAFAELVRLGLSVSELARRIGKGPGFVSARLAIADFPPQARRLLDGVAFSVGALGLLARLPPAKRVEILASRPFLATSTDAARDALRECPALDGATFDAAGCADCPRRFGEPPVCLDADCFAAKTDTAAQAAIARIRSNPDRRALPLVAEKPVLDFAPEAFRSFAKRSRVRPLDGERVADDGETGPEAILLAPGKTPRVVRLVDAPRPRDARADRYADRDGHADRMAAREEAAAVADRLSAAVYAAPQPIADADFHARCIALAEAVDGHAHSTATAFHCLLTLAVPAVLRRLRAPASADSATERRELVARVRQILGEPTP